MAQPPPATNICCSLPFCSHTLLLDPIMEMAKRAAYSTAVTSLHACRKTLRGGIPVTLPNTTKSTTAKTRTRSRDRDLDP
jgi:hypothetical protein